MLNVKLLSGNGYIAELFCLVLYGLSLTVLLCISGEAFNSVNSESRELPAVELSTLPLIPKV